jgi:hypothetical protein
VSTNIRTIRHWEGSVKCLEYKRILCVCEVLEYKRILLEYYWSLIGVLLRSYVDFYVGVWEIFGGVLTKNARV